tara:strand:- start:194 stop:343 length:150 start_codon:yes stop_codon:yes gene_type:complete
VKLNINSEPIVPQPAAQVAPSIKKFMSSNNLHALENNQNNLDDNNIHNS